MQNIVILAGNIGQAPEIRTTQGGTKITNFTLATSRPRLSEGKVIRDDNGYRVMDTEWHRITCFNGLGQTVADNCEKGMKVLVQGRIHYTKWTDAAGNDRYGCEIIAEKIDFLSRPKAAECLEKDREDLLTFYDFPAEHWIHLRTTNPIESTFATVRLRTAKTRGCLTRDTMLTMVFKLTCSAQKRWRRLNVPERLADVITGVNFVNGVKQKKEAA